jgi:hypothetical protein
VPVKASATLVKSTPNLDLALLFDPVFRFVSESAGEADTTQWIKVGLPFFKVLTPSMHYISITLLYQKYH